MKRQKKNLKRMTALIMTAVLMLSLAACGEDSTSDTDTADATLYGQVESVGDGTITLLLGEMVTDEESTGDAGSAEGSDDGSEAETGEAPSGEGNMPSGDSGMPSEGGDAPSGDAPSEYTEDTDDTEDPSGDDTSAEVVSEGEVPSGDGEMPSGEAGDMEIPTGEAGEEGDFSDEVPSGDMSTGTGFSGTFEAGTETVTLEVSDDLSDMLSSLSEGDVVMVVTDSDSIVTSITEWDNFSGGDMGGDMGGNMGGGSSDVEQGSYANLIDEDGTYSDNSYTSTGDDENALRIDGATVTLENITVDKSSGSSSDTENGDFYGVNAAVLATNGAQVTITGATVTSSVQNGNGVFSYGSGTVVNISDSVITTTADNSGGIQTTGGGTTNASNLTVQTQGTSSAAIRSDRGGGTVNVSGGTYVTDGYNSPAVYSTAAITVENATLTANNSEALVVEGQNSITLADCVVSGNMSDEYGASSSINVHNIMIYQSTSGDAEEGTSYFTATGGSITSHNGDMFYITNTACVITLSGVDFINNDTDGNFMTIAGNDASNGWGSAGSNGAQVELTCTDQEIEGDITVDTISTLNLTLSEGSSLTGTINIVENEEGGTAVSDNVVVTIDEDSEWTLTGDCTITSITNNGTINYNGYTITLADGTVLSE